MQNKIQIILILLISASTINAKAQSWDLTGNTGTSSLTNYIGTNDGNDFVIRTSSTERLRILSTGKIGIGVAAPTQKLDIAGNINLSSGSAIYINKKRVFSADGLPSGRNTFVGYLSGNVTTGTFDDFIGYQAGYSNTSGTNNSFLGANAGRNNTIGSANTFSGAYAGYSNTAGNNNVAGGFQSLYSNTTGVNNTGVGAGALQSNTNGYSNVAIGTGALKINTIGLNLIAIGDSSQYNYLGNAGTFGYPDDNVAIGSKALYTNDYGFQNTAVGSAALYSNFGDPFGNGTGSSNSAFGNAALFHNSYGEANTAVGQSTLFINTNGTSNTAVGYGSLYSCNGINNTGLGGNTDVSSALINDAAAIGGNAIVNASQKIRIGSPNITVVESQVGSWTTSDGRFKTNITEDVKGLEFIKKLHPVIYNFDTRKLKNS